MARIYPEVDTGITVRSERLFYRWLRDGLDDSCTVFHGIELLTLEPSDTLKIGEADFLVIHKDRGLLVIEVKGGEVRRVPSKNRW
ncbi:MAG: NERD domain-containing protein, partial [Actinomycetia bacterium]|nr:NERD domain-containing protein [Actinomycetes bacterium]MCG2796542.1 NERD domain-containing protein [Actinomycetes bacterium]